MRWSYCGQLLICGGLTTCAYRVRGPWLALAGAALHEVKQRTTYVAGGKLSPTIEGKDGANGEGEAASTATRKAPCRLTVSS